MAMDFAVTFGVRQSAVQASIQDSSHAVTSYEDFKRNHLDTARLCTEAGITFVPMVLEANGGVWGPSACKIFSELAKTKSVHSGEQKDKILGQLYQNLDVVLQRENSRAILRRMGTLKHNISNIANAAATVLSEAGQ